MTPEQRQVVEQRRKKFHSLSFEEQKRIKRKYKWYKDLSPAKQNRVVK